LRPAVFLDRDGTLNRQVVRDGKPYPPDTVEEFTLFPGVVDACADLARAGYVLVVATNQPDVGRGKQDQAIVEAMHAKLRELVPAIEHIEARYSPGRAGDPPDSRRKPEPGMLLEAAMTHGLDLGRSWMVGRPLARHRLRETRRSAHGFHRFRLHRGTEGPARLHRDIVPRGRPNYPCPDLTPKPQSLHEIAQRP
jgi:histidinol-phosphate phosphatase family protein